MEVTPRLQNFYESIRRQIFLDNNDKSESARYQTVDGSARDFKYKYIIERSYTHLDLMFFN